MVRWILEMDGGGLSSMCATQRGQHLAGTAWARDTVLCCGRQKVAGLVPAVDRDAA